MNHQARHLILHFGLEKTGTSAIQRTLYDQRETLLKNHGTLYPGQYESHFLFRALFAERPESLFRIQMLGLNGRKAIADFLENYRQEIVAEVNNTKPEQIIISSEYFREMNEDELGKMHEFLKTIAEDITLFAYIRDPWSWSISLFQEQIMTGYARKEGRARYLLTLPKMLAKFEGVFGVRPVIAPYINTHRNFNAAVDFCRRFHLTGLEATARKNSHIRGGMKREAACIMLELNRLYPVFDEDKNFIQDPARDLAREIIRKSPLSRTPMHISTKTAEEIYKNSRDGIQVLEEQYFGGERPFTERYHALQTSESDDTYSISMLDREQVSEYLLSCLYTLAEQVIEEQNSVRSLAAAKTGLEDELLEIKGSTAWKAVLAFRRAHALIAPAHSRRGRIWRQLTHFVLSVGASTRRKQNDKGKYPAHGTRLMDTRAGNAKS